MWQADGTILFSCMGLTLKLNLLFESNFFFDCYFHGPCYFLLWLLVFFLYLGWLHYCSLLKLMRSYFLAWPHCFVGCCLPLKLWVVLIEHWIAEIDFASIDFAWDDTLLMVHSLCGGGLEVVLGHVHNALGNKFDERFVALASHDWQLSIGLVPYFLLGLLWYFSLL